MDSSCDGLAREIVTGRKEYAALRLHMKCVLISLDRQKHLDQVHEPNDRTLDEEEKSNCFEAEEMNQTCFQNVEEWSKTNITRNNSLQLYFFTLSHVNWADIENYVEFLSKEMPDIKIDENGLFEVKRRLNAYLNSNKLEQLENQHAEKLGLKSNPGEDMGACECIVPSRHGGTLNSRRSTSPLVRLVEGEEMWVVPDPPPGCSLSKLGWN
ncbi:hypothetical protein TNCV_4116481 [Trichonephila clavipes]|nr:hypothetical protein TNCV_4116481 [Trichonephila clavipes]